MSRTPTSVIFIVCASFRVTAAVVMEWSYLVWASKRGVAAEDVHPTPDQVTAPRLGEHWFFRLLSSPHFGITKSNGDEQHAQGRDSGYRRGHARDRCVAGGREGPAGGPREGGRGGR